MVQSRYLIGPMAMPKGATFTALISGGGGAWSFCLAIFSHQNRLEIFISMFLYLFQPPVWVKY